MKYVELVAKNELTVAY